MATVLAIVQAAYGEMGLPQPASLLTTGSTEAQAKALIENHARFLRNYTKLPQQKRSHSFSTTASRAKYPLPEDFYGMVGDTGQDRTNLQALRGPHSDPIVNQILYEYQIVDDPYGFRIFGPDGAASAATSGGQFQVVPTPASTVTISFDYYSKNTFFPAYWAASTAVSMNEYRSANGNIYKYTGAGNTHASTPPSHTSGSASDGTATALYISAAYETVIANTDLCIFDDDIMIQGVIDRYRKSKSQPISLDPITGLSTEHKILVERATSRYTNSYRGRFDRPARGPQYYIPYRGHI